MNKPIYVVGGSKGGVGKSLVSMAMTHFLTEAREKVFLIDADTSNPDVFKSYGAEVQCELVNLDDADGWIRFVNICDENKDAAVVVNTAARNNQGVAAYGATLSKSLEELDRDLVTLWVINRQRDSLELLEGLYRGDPGLDGPCGQERLFRRRRQIRAVQQFADQEGDRGSWGPVGSVSGHGRSGVGRSLQQPAEHPEGG